MEVMAAMKPHVPQVRYRKFCHFSGLSFLLKVSIEGGSIIAPYISKQGPQLGQFLY
jgi:hypothetical protein